MNPKCQTLSQAIEGLYAELSVVLEMAQLNQEVKEVDEKSIRVRATMDTLSLDAYRDVMKQNTTLVARARKLWDRK